MVQPENEVGTYRSVRDYSPTAQALFEGQVPTALLQHLNRQPGTWTEVFGETAEETFMAWSIGSYVGQVAAAGKAEYPLPMYANAALGDPFNRPTPGSYASGGPVWSMIEVWQAAAPAIDFLAPDIYDRPSARAERHLDRYARADNPLFVAEIGNDQPYARYLFSTLGRRGLGFSPFGIDYTGYSNFPLGAKEITEETLTPFRDAYRLIAPWQRVWAKAAYEGDVWGVAEPDDRSAQTIDLGDWTATVNYQQWQFGGTGATWFGELPKPEATVAPNGGVLIARLNPGEFFLTAHHARVELSPKDPASRLMILRYEEGHFDAEGQMGLRAHLERRPDRLRPEFHGPPAPAARGHRHLLTDDVTSVCHDPFPSPEVRRHGAGSGRGGAGRGLRLADGAGGLDRPRPAPAGRRDRRSVERRGEGGAAAGLWPAHHPRHRLAG